MVVNLTGLVSSHSLLEASCRQKISVGPIHILFCCFFVSVLEAYLTYYIIIWIWSTQHNLVNCMKNILLRKISLKMYCVGIGFARSKCVHIYIQANTHGIIIFTIFFIFLLEMTCERFYYMQHREFLWRKDPDNNNHNPDHYRICPLNCATTHNLVS